MYRPEDAFGNLHHNHSWTGMTADGTSYLQHFFTNIDDTRPLLSLLLALDPMGGGGGGGLGDQRHRA